MSEKRESSGLTRRQERMKIKADLLDALSQHIHGFEPYASDGLTRDEVAAVFDETADQLYRWAVRITPVQEDE